MERSAGSERRVSSRLVTYCLSGAQGQFSPCNILPLTTLQTVAKQERRVSSRLVTYCLSQLSRRSPSGGQNAQQFPGNYVFQFGMP